MINAARLPGRHMALIVVAAMLLMSGCTLSGSSGIGNVTPVPGGEEGDTPAEQPPTVEVPPTPIPPTATQALTELEVLGTEAAVTATAQALGVTAGAAAGTTPGAETVTTPGAVVTSDAGGEIAAPTATPIGTPVEVAGTVCPPTHTVVQGENMFRIALRYGMSYQELASANGIANPNQISVGLVLNIPGCGVTQTGDAGGPVVSGTTHTVQAGENMYRIALRYGLTYTALAAANGITNPDFVVVGQVLQIPQ